MTEDLPPRRISNLLAMAIIGISSIHLLRTFIEAGASGQPKGRITEAAILWQTVIQMAEALGLGTTPTARPRRRFALDRRA